SVLLPVCRVAFDGEASRFRPSLAGLVYSLSGAGEYYGRGDAPSGHGCGYYPVGHVVGYVAASCDDYSHVPTPALSAIASATLAFIGSSTSSSLMRASSSFAARSGVMASTRAAWANASSSSATIGVISAVISGLRRRMGVPCRFLSSVNGTRAVLR